MSAPNRVPAHAPESRPWSEALARAICRQYLAGVSVERIASATGLREDRVREILRERIEGAS